MAEDDIKAALRLKKPTRYVREIQTKQISDETAFEKTLLYAGVGDAGLKLSYREFIRDMARPAFTEELSIPLGKSYPQDVAVKDMVFRIHSIDGMGLTYEILAPGQPERG